MGETKSLIEQIYDMDKETLRKYAVDMLKTNAKYFRTIRDIFKTFDEYACIKDDEWYKDLKNKYIEK